MIDVVAAVIKNQEGKYLITQRNFKKVQGGLWEFPGGKVEENESKEHAIEREIKEELTLNIKAKEILGEKVFDYTERSINLIAVHCEKISGEVILNEHEAYAWVTPDKFKDYEFAPADEFIVKLLNNK